MTGQHNEDENQDDDDDDDDEHYLENANDKIDNAHNNRAICKAHNARQSKQSTTSDDWNVYDWIRITLHYREPHGGECWRDNRWDNEDGDDG